MTKTAYEPRPPVIQVQKGLRGCPKRPTAVPKTALGSSVLDITKIYYPFWLRPFWLMGRFWYRPSKTLHLMENHHILTILNELEASRSASFHCLFETVVHRAFR